MTTDQVKRKFTPILSADVKGCSRLMDEDEEWTLRTLNTYKVGSGELQWALLENEGLSFRPIGTKRLLLKKRISWRLCG